MPAAQSKLLTECWLIDQTTPNKGECQLTNDNDNSTMKRVAAALTLVVYLCDNMMCHTVSQL